MSARASLPAPGMLEALARGVAGAGAARRRTRAREGHGGRAASCAALLLGAALAALGAAPSPALDPRELPAVARPRFQLGERTLGSGTAFFVRAPGAAGVAAVTTAHAFSFDELARADEVAFLRGRRGERVARASRLLAEPGRPFAAPGGTLRDDFLIFALDAAPRGMRVLELASEAPPRPGDRVRLLGAPAGRARDQDDLYGSVRRVGATRIEVDLDVPADLRGWGGAPVLAGPEERVVGILQAAWPERDRMRLGVAPIDGVREALTRPLEGGRGRPFAALRGRAATPAVAEAGDPSSGAPGAQGEAPRGGKASGPSETVAASLPAADEPTPEARAPDAAADEEPSLEPVDEPVEPVDSAAAVSARRAATPRDPDAALLGEAGEVTGHLHLEVETPADGSLVGGGEAGVFVAGRAFRVVDGLRRYDVILVLDTSGSTASMTGADVNGNGIVGEDGLAGMLGASDPGDSILAAEVAAARRMLDGLDPRTTRVGLVSFAGDPPRRPGVLVIGAGRRPAAIVEEPLTRDFARVRRSLERLLERGPEGMTDMARAVDTAWLELTGVGDRSLSEVDPESEKAILFLTDGQPTLPYDAIYEAENVRAVLRAAGRAARLGVAIHAFAIGPEALDGPVATVEMAGRTGGSFTPVRHPADIVRVIENVRLADVERVEIRNRSLDAPASLVQVGSDGSFGALVPLRSGRNRLRVVARTEDGEAAERSLVVDHAPGTPPPTLPRELLARRTRLLERRLVEIRRANAAAEREELERTRKELAIEIEKERETAQERAARQRKELEIGPLEPVAAPGGNVAGPAEAAPAEASPRPDPHEPPEAPSPDGAGAR